MSNELKYGAFDDSLLIDIWLLRLGSSLERGDGRSISTGRAAHMLVWLSKSGVFSLKQIEKPIRMLSS